MVDWCGFLSADWTLINAVCLPNSVLCFYFIYQLSKHFYWNVAEFSTFSDPDHFLQTNWKVFHFYILNKWIQNLLNLRWNKNDFLLCIQILEFIGDTYYFSIKDHIMREVSPDVTFHLAYSSSLWTAFIFLFLVKHHLYLEGQIKWYN